jgi:hypothetical protein
VGTALRRGHAAPAVERRPSAALAGIAGALREIATKLPLVFPVHPRTRGNLERSAWTWART